MVSGGGAGRAAAAAGAVRAPPARARLEVLGRDHAAPVPGLLADPPRGRAREVVFCEGEERPDGRREVIEDRLQLRARGGEAGEEGACDARTSHQARRWRGGRALRETAAGAGRRARRDGAAERLVVQDVPGVDALHELVLALPVRAGGVEGALVHPQVRPARRRQQRVGPSARDGRWTWASLSCTLVQRRRGAAPRT